MSDVRRASERVVPMVLDEEMVVIEYGNQRFLSKMMDLSEGGTLLYILTESPPEFIQGSACQLSLYHKGKVFSISSAVTRTNGRLLAFQFSWVGPDAMAQLQAKLIRMEVEWNRLQALA